MEPRHPQAPILDVSVPSFRYNAAPVLHRIEIKVDRRTLVALIGPNGSGKSTLLKIAGGLLRGEGASVVIEGKSIDDLSYRDVARLISWVPQRAEQVFAMTVREMVRVGRYRVQRPLRPLPDSEESRIDSALESTGIGHLANREVDTLSGGEWQRALIARAVAQDTPILLLDEPVASLDLRYQDEVYLLLRRLASAGRLILVADHHLEVAASYADRTLLLEAGKIVADGPPGDVLTSEKIASVFGVELDVFPDPVTGSPRLSRPRSAE